MLRLVSEATETDEALLAIRPSAARRLSRMRNPEPTAPEGVAN